MEKTHDSSDEDFDETIISNALLCFSGMEPREYDVICKESLSGRLNGHVPGPLPRPPSRRSRADRDRWKTGPMSSDPFDLARFVSAQEPVFAAVLAELRAGRKRTHWMWFVFPQLRGLGASPMATFYGIGSLAEAVAFLAHPVLGERLVLCTHTVLGIAHHPLPAIFGAPDDAKFRSSMTLFAHAADARGTTRDAVFATALDRLCAGCPDEHTMKLLGA